MGFTKHASFEVSEILDVKGSPQRMRTANLSRISDYTDYRTEDGYLYARIRAISSRVNRNHDGWPAVELAGSPEIFEQHTASEGFTVEASKDHKTGFSTFLGKPIFVDHCNSDPKRARGVIVDSRFHVEDQKIASADPYYSSSDVDPDHMPASWVELLLEVDAERFPRLAGAIIAGSKNSAHGIDGFSMGCFITGTPITLGDGTQKPIETIEINDEVLTHTGKVEPVTFVMNRPHKGVVYDVKTYGQSVPMILTEEHPVWTKAGWVEARDLTIGDFVLSPTLEGTGHPGGAYPFARLLGYYLAEGSLCFDRKRFEDGRPVSVEWNFNVDEVEYIEEVQTLLEAIGYRAAGPYVKNNCASIRCNSPELAQRFLDYGGQHSWNKRLHREVMSWDLDNQRGLLQAYFNGDGCYRNDGKRVEAGTASQSLAQQLQLIATRVGVKMTPPVKQHSPSAISKRPKFSMQAVLEPDVTKVHYGAHLDEQGLWRRISDIGIREYEGNVYNFDVEGDDSYVAADIAVHNCDVDHTICNICSNKASSPDEFCDHIRMKGATFDFHDSKTGKRTGKKSYENCYGIKFFEISAVFDPADETALLRELIHKEASAAPLERVADNPIPQSENTTAPEAVDTLRKERVCPVCGSDVDAEKCDVCGYVEPPDGLNVPDLDKHQELKEEQELMAQPEESPVEGEVASPLDASNEVSPAGVTGRVFEPRIHPRLAGRINDVERPIQPGANPATDEPVEKIIKDESTPVTSHTAAGLIEAAGQTQTQENSMAKNRVAAEPADPSGKPDKRIPVDGVGGFMDANPEAASAPDKRIDPEGKGGFMDADNASASAPDEKQTIDETSENSGFDEGGNKNNNSGPTKTFGDNGTGAVTDKAFPTAAAKGTKPNGGADVQPQRREDVESDEHWHNEGTPTSQWSGTNGNGVTRQQDPVTKKVDPNISVSGITSHIVNVMKLADCEIDLGIIAKEAKYARIAELEQEDMGVIAARLDTYSRVRTAGLKKQTTPSVTRMPSFRTASAPAEPSETVDKLNDPRYDDAIFGV